MDREIVGKLAINYYSGLPYKQFMKNLAKNSDVIAEEAEDRAEAFVEANSPDFGEDPVVDYDEALPALQESPVNTTQSGTGGLDNAPEIANIDKTQNTEEHGEQRIGDLSGGGTIDELGGVPVTPAETNYDDMGEKPRNEIDFEAMSESRTDVPVEFAEEGYRDDEPSSNVTQPETQYSTNQSPAEPSVLSNYGEETTRIEEIVQETKQETARQKEQEEAYVNEKYADDVAFLESLQKKD
jgi:hypothetical protein